MIRDTPACGLNRRAALCLGGGWLHEVTGVQGGELGGFADREPDVCQPPPALGEAITRDG